MMRTLITLCLVFLGLSSVAASGQVIGENKSGDAAGTYTMSVTSRLVIEAVTVKDKKGNPIDGLTAQDFVLTEDGVPQTIKFFEHQTLPTADQENKATNAIDDVRTYKRLSRTQIAPEAQGDLKYRDRRLMALYFDMSAMPPADQMRALEAAQRFIREQMTSADLVAILRYSEGSVDVLQDFSADRNRLMSILSTLVVGEGQGEEDSVSDASAADTGSAFGQDDSEFNIFNTDRQLAALQTAAQMLGHLNEKKSLIYFASGLHLNGLDNQAQLRATVDAAVRAGVSLWPIDARGLVASAPLGDASQGSPGNSGMYTGASSLAVTSRFQQSQDTLYALAADTGGKALLDNNDLTHGIIEAQRAVTSYYILGYYTTNTALDGKFRKVKVSLKPELASAALDYRQGYFAGKQFSKFTTADKERQLEDALMLGDPITELTIALEINYFQLNRAEYFVPIVVKIPGRELALAKKGGAEQTVIDFIGEIKDAYGGSTVTNLRDHISRKLTGTTVEELTRSPIEYTTGYTLLPGKYIFKFLARDDETGRIGTFQTTFVIPNLNKETKLVPISSIVLSSEHKSYRDAIYNASKGKEQDKQAAADPLIQGGQQIIPSVTRVFSRQRTLTVFLQAYAGPTAAPTPSGTTAAAGSSGAALKPASASQPAAAPDAKHVIAFVSLFQKGAMVYESQPVDATPDPNSRLGTTSLNFNVDLKSLPAGRYDCQVTVLDPAGQKGAFWTTPILLVP